MSHVIVCEYASLTTEACEASLNLARVSESAFDYLCSLSERFQRGGARLLQVNGRYSLRLDSYVGVIQTPCGTTIEILPKHLGSNDPIAVKSCRRLLRRLLESMFKLPSREAGEAKLENFELPLNEWVVSKFLNELSRIVLQGMRFGYQRVEEDQPFLRGQLNLIEQLRQPPGRAHHFQIRHDVFTPNRPENRLLKLALDRVQNMTEQADNWRLARELSVRLEDVSSSKSVDTDFNAWVDDRLMAHYRDARPWCELILRHTIPMALNGRSHGLSLLFPMEKLFEHHVAACLKQQLSTRCNVRTPTASETLCIHDGRPIFRLEPDIFVELGHQRWVLDTKWKLLNQADREHKYDLSQADFYQLYAYGQKYMNGDGRLALIYPQTRQFDAPLAPFSFSTNLQLYVLPFDLETDNLIGVGIMGLPQQTDTLLGAA